MNISSGLKCHFRMVCPSSVVPHPYSTWKLRARSVFLVRDLCMFRVPRAHDVFVGPGFKPLTLQHDRFVGPGFESQARPPVSGP